MYSEKISFRPKKRSTFRLSASPSQSISLSFNLNSTTTGVRIYNATSNITFIEFGGSDVSASSDAMPLPGSQTETFEIGGATHIAAYSLSGTASLYVTAGDGL